MTFVPVEEDFTTTHKGVKYFVLDTEDGSFYSFGHRDPIEFLKEVNSYLHHLGDDILPVGIGYVHQTWAIVTVGDREDEWRFIYGDHIVGRHGAFPITYIL